LSDDEPEELSEDEDEDEADDELCALPMSVWAGNPPQPGAIELFQAAPPQAPGAPE